MLTFVDAFLNRTTMYRLVLLYLFALIASALVFGWFGMLPIKPADLLFSTLLILAVCWVSNFIFASAYGAMTNRESFLITALILALILTPVAPTNSAVVGFLVFASAWAMASKYIFAIGKKHLFNPAAFGVAISTLLIGQSATWWVAGNTVLLPFVFFGGLLVVRKMRRSGLVSSFFIFAILTVAATSRNIPLGLSQTVFHSSIFFLAFAMLTEPLTMPPDFPRRVLVGSLVGFLFAPTVHIGTYYFTPETALLAGNLFSYLVSPKGRFLLFLREKRMLTKDTYEFVFAPERFFPFLPGQYVEWTLAHASPDNRGNRRYFTIASSPAEERVRFGIKFYEPMSSFKRALLAMKPGGAVSVSNLAGDFTLPSDTQTKLAFLAGGIGITPFASMLEHMLATGDARDAVLLYANNTEEEIAYQPLLAQAEHKLGTKIVRATGVRLDAQRIAREIPDYRTRIFYISGPHGMVEAFRNMLLEIGVPRRRMKVDFFPGFA